MQRLVVQVYVGIRGRALTNLCANFDLQIANDGDDEDVVASWTFCNLMGVTRKIDLILCSVTFTLSKSCAANQLELGSDHRAYTGLKFPRKENARVWKPQCFGLYHTTLSAQLRHLVLAPIQGLERAVSRIATAVHKKTNLKCGIQNRLYQRRNCCDQTQRTPLSKNDSEIPTFTHARKTQPSHFHNFVKCSQPGRHGGDSF